MTLEEINKEISQLEPAEINVRNVQVLSSLYTIRENFSKSFVPTVYKMPELKGSELNEAVSDIQIYDLLEILNEHMEVVKALIPKEYQAVIDKIREAK